MGYISFSCQKTKGLALRRQKGVSALGYGLLIGLIGVVALAAITNVGSSINTLFGAVSGDLGSAVVAGSGGQAGAEPSATPSLPTSCDANITTDPMVGMASTFSGSGVFISASGSGTVCTAGQPCSLSEAFANHQSNGETFVFDGAVSVPSTLTITQDNMTFRALSGRSVLTWTGSGTSTPIFELSGGRSGLTFEFLELDGSTGIRWASTRSNMTIRNMIFSNGAQGIAITGSDSPQGDVTVSNSRFENISGTGITARVPYQVSDVVFDGVGVGFSAVPQTSFFVTPVFSFDNVVMRNGVNTALSLSNAKSSGSNARPHKLVVDGLLIDNHQGSVGIGTSTGSGLRSGFQEALLSDVVIRMSGGARGIDINHSNNTGGMEFDMSGGCIEGASAAAVDVQGTNFNMLTRFDGVDVADSAEGYRARFGINDSGSRRFSLIVQNAAINATSTNSIFVDWDGGGVNAEMCLAVENSLMSSQIVIDDDGNNPASAPTRIVEQLSTLGSRNGDAVVTLMGSSAGDIVDGSGGACVVPTVSP